MTLPGERDNLRSDSDAPEFERGIYASSAASIPRQPWNRGWGLSAGSRPSRKNGRPYRIESKLREYNKFNLKLLVLHEAVPGHYVQGEFANNVETKSTRTVAGYLFEMVPIWKAGLSTLRR